VAAPSVVGIWNRALQLVGAKQVAGVDDVSVSALACQACYDPIRQSELRKHGWNFAIKRAQLAAASPVPEWGRSNAFPLPSDCLKLWKTYVEYNNLDVDFEIEGRHILTNFSAPLNIRYIFDCEDTALMDSLFREALAHQMAVAMCEQLTQSNAKKQGLENAYREVIQEARKANAMEKIAQQSPDDTWITIRA
jgi:hypothetical protein